MSTWFVESNPRQYDGIDKLDPQLEAEFEILFGDRPTATTHGSEWRELATKYDDQKKYFKGITMPNYPPEQVENAMATLEAWGFVRPVFYNHRYEVLARFPNTDIRFTPGASAVVGFTHITIASWQVKEIKAGRKVAQVHPFVPPKYSEMNSQLPDPKE